MGLTKWMENNPGKSLMVGAGLIITSIMIFALTIEYYLVSKAAKAKYAQSDHMANPSNLDVNSPNSMANLIMNPVTRQAIICSRKPKFAFPTREVPANLHPITFAQATVGCYENGR